MFDVFAQCSACSVCLSTCFVYKINGILLNLVSFPPPSSLFKAEASLNNLTCKDEYTDLHQTWYAYFLRRERDHTMARFRLVLREFLVARNLRTIKSNAESEVICFREEFAEINTKTAINYFGYNFL